MHSVIAINCTGCGLCVDDCPVDCISMLPCQPQIAGDRWSHYETCETNHWRQLAYKRRQRRQSQLSAENGSTADLSASGIQQQIRDAVNRERQKRWKNRRKREIHTPLKRLSG